MSHNGHNGHKPLRLNLGCGRAQFPAEPGAKVVAHIAAYLPDSAYDEAAGWVNVDRIRQSGVQQVVDTFHYPWPWADNSVDEIWASHIVEHIPHDPKVRFFAPRILRDLVKHAHDGFYAWFYEAWRVLKPGGLIHIVCPWAWCVTGMSDPQHTRYITSQTFSYLQPQKDDAPFQYQIPFYFEAIGEPTLRTRGIPDKNWSLEQIQEQMNYHINRIDEIALIVRAVK